MMSGFSRIESQNHDEKTLPAPPEIVQRARCRLAPSRTAGLRRRHGQHPRPPVRQPHGQKSGTGSGSARDVGAAVSNRTDSEIIEKLRIVLSRIDCGPQQSRASSTPTGGAAIFCAHTLLVDVRATCPVWYGKAVRRKNAVRHHQTTAIRGGVFTRLWNASPMGWKPLSQKLPNWERKST